jgi:hypothetical protein
MLRAIMHEDGMRLVIDDAQKALKSTRAFAANEVADLAPPCEAQRCFGIKSR